MRGVLVHQAEMPAIEFFLRHKLAPAIDNAVARSAPSERRGERSQSAAGGVSGLLPGRAPA